MEKYYIGSDLKFALTITSQGFDMDVDNWTAKVTCGNKSITFSRGNGAIIDGNGQWYLTINTKDLGIGSYYLVVEIDVPDEDFDDGLRHEVLAQEVPICNVSKIPSYFDKFYFKT